LPRSSIIFADRTRWCWKRPPGAARRTRVPPALLGLTSRDVLVLEPRRWRRDRGAIRCAEMGERVGETVGYQVAFEEIAGRARGCDS